MTDKKSWIEIILMPLVIALVGVGGTLIVMNQQESNAQTRADSDRQIKVLEIFAAKISSDKEEERQLALRMLEAVDGKLAVKLAAAVVDTEADDIVRGVAQDVVARVTHTPRVYLHIKGEEQRDAAEGVAAKLEEKGWIVPRTIVTGEKSPRNPQLRYFRKTEKSKAEEIYNIVSDGWKVDLSYLPGYEDSPTIRPMHFEIWFGLGS